MGKTVLIGKPNVVSTMQKEKSPGHEIFFATTRVCRKEKVMGCNLISFQRSADEIRYIFQFYVLIFQTFLMLQKKTIYIHIYFFSPQEEKDMGVSSDCTLYERSFLAMD